MAEISIFAAFYLLAQAIERILEFISENKPFSNSKIAIDSAERKIKDWHNIVDKLIGKDHGIMVNSII